MAYVNYTATKNMTVYDNYCSTNKRAMSTPSVNLPRNPNVEKGYIPAAGKLR